MEAAVEEIKGRTQGGAAKSPADELHEDEKAIDDQSGAELDPQKNNRTMVAKIEYLKRAGRVSESTDRRMLVCHRQRPSVGPMGRHQQRGHFKSRLQEPSYRTRIPYQRTPRWYAATPKEKRYDLYSAGSPETK